MDVKGIMIFLDLILRYNTGKSGICRKDGEVICIKG
jgi:hypothetical protein